MKEIVKILGRRYSSVSTHDHHNDPLNPIPLAQQSRSFHTRQSLSRGLSIVDSFFNKRETGKRTRSPKGM